MADQVILAPPKLVNFTYESQSHHGRGRFRYPAHHWHVEWPRNQKLALWRYNGARRRVHLLSPSCCLYSIGRIKPRMYSKQSERYNLSGCIWRRMVEI